jgi:hypothetical protein
MKVIAIKDGPQSENGFTYKNKFYQKAYQKGDTFEVYDQSISNWNEYLIIYHDKLETNMDVNPNNFIELNKWREMKLNQIGI